MTQMHTADVDFEPLASSPEQPRWRNAAQWARNALREKGLVRDDSPHGVWAISDKGRAWLDRQSKGQLATPTAPDSNT